MSYERALEEYITALHTQDFDCIQNLLHRKATFLLPHNRTCSTIKDIKEYYSRHWNTYKELSYNICDIKWLAVGNGNATCSYLYNFSGVIQGQHTNGYGRITNIFIQGADHRWRLIHEHSQI